MSVVCSKNRVEAGRAGTERARRRAMEETGAPGQEELIDQEKKGFGSNSRCDGKPLDGRTQEREMAIFIF